MELTIQSTPTLKAAYPGSIALDWESQFVEELMRLTTQNQELSDFLFTTSEGDGTVVATAEGDTFKLVDLYVFATDVIGAGDDAATR